MWRVVRSSRWISAARPIVGLPSRSFAIEAKKNQHDQYEKEINRLASDKLHENTPKPRPIKFLAAEVKEGILDLAPSYQRGYVWKEDRASRLIVTVLCDRIMPGIVLHERKYGQYDVVDGKQRLTSLMSFYFYGKDRNQFEKLRGSKRADAPELLSSLKGLDENYQGLEGLTYNDLSEARKKRFDSFDIPCTVIPYKTPKGDVFACYEDINSGGANLSAQQLRRAVYYGKYIELLDRLAMNKDFQSIRDPDRSRNGTYRQCPEESDRELILRALAFARASQEFQKPLKIFLNKHLEYHDKQKEPQLDEDIKSSEEEFVSIMKIWRNVFSENGGAFRAWKEVRSGQWAWYPVSGVNKGLWDVLFTVLKEIRLEHATEPVFARNKEALQAAIQDLYKSGKLVSTAVASTKDFNNRRDLLKAAILNVLGKVAKRSFPNAEEMKPLLFKKQNGLCGICGETIDPSRLSDGSYVHVDHRIPHAVGGPPTQDNASLTHAACNLSKGAGSPSIE